MKARYIQRGESIDYIPAAKIAAGDIVQLGKLVGVAKLDINPGELGALALVGVYEIPSGELSIAIGDIVSVDPATGKAVADGTAGAIKFGYAITAASPGVSRVNVRLQQGLGA